MRAFETDEGGLEKQFIFYLALVEVHILKDFENASPRLNPLLDKL